VEANQIERRLAAILATDIVGYSRLVEKDEASTLAAIRKLRAEVIDPLLAKYHGRVVKLNLQGKIALVLDYRGEQQVKNIARPVRTYSVRLEGLRRHWLLDARRLRRWRLPVAVVLVLLVGGAAIWLRQPPLDKLHRLTAWRCHCRINPRLPYCRSTTSVPIPSKATS
jgi:hypothetical protein